MTGKSVADNVRKLRRQLVPPAEKWARESGSVFEGDKTAFTIFVRPLQPTPEPSTPSLCAKTVIPKESVKILGVTLDLDSLCMSMFRKRSHER